jgi:hypothetical protein
MNNNNNNYNNKGVFNRYEPVRMPANLSKLTFADAWYIFALRLKPSIRVQANRLSEKKESR